MRAAGTDLLVTLPGSDAIAERSVIHVVRDGLALWHAIDTPAELSAIVDRLAGPAASPTVAGEIAAALDALVAAGICAIERP